MCFVAALIAERSLIFGTPTHVNVSSHPLPNQNQEENVFAGLYAGEFIHTHVFEIQFQGLELLRLVRFFELRSVDTGPKWWKNEFIVLKSCHNFLTRP